MNQSIQLRGHCPVCGNVQAVTGGVMSNHGYTVDHGYFHGVCAGRMHPPLQKSRELTDRTAIMLNDDAINLYARAAKIRNGTELPAMILRRTNERLSNGKRKTVIVQWEDCTPAERATEIRELPGRLEYRAKLALEHAKMILELADRIYGTELFQVERTAGPAPIKAGEQRKQGDHVVTCAYVDKGRVYYTHPARPGFKYWIGTQGWRRLEVAQ